MIKTGVIGAGHLGKIHIEQILKINELQLVGFYDENIETALAVEKKFNTKFYPDTESLIKECDAIHIVTPTISHFEIAQQAIKYGKHIFIEKPITQTVEEARKLIELIREADIKCQVGHVERFNPAYIATKRFIQNPMFIEVHRMSQFNPRGTDVSVVLDLMIHDIDIVLNLVKSDIKRISASGVNIISPNTDIANVRIEFGNGCVANLTASRISLKKMRKIRCFQKDTYVSIDFLEKKSEIVKLTDEYIENALPFEIDLGNGDKKTIQIARPEVPDVNAIRLEIEMFKDAIMHNTEVPVTASQGLQALDVATEILQKINALHAE